MPVNIICHNQGVCTAVCIWWVEAREHPTVDKMVSTIKNGD